MIKFQHSKYTSLLAVIIFAISATNCSVRVDGRPKVVNTKAKRLPPGQAKKIYGGKSARSYAPGHNKNS